MPDYLRKSQMFAHGWAAWTSTFADQDSPACRVLSGYWFLDSFKHHLIQFFCLSIFQDIFRVLNCNTDEYHPRVLHNITPNLLWRLLLPDQHFARGAHPLAFRRRRQCLCLTSNFFETAECKPYCWSHNDKSFSFSRYSAWNQSFIAIVPLRRKQSWTIAFRLDRTKNELLFAYWKIRRRENRWDLEDILVMLVTWHRRGFLTSVLRKREAKLLAFLIWAVRSLSLCFTGLARNPS